MPKVFISYRRSDSRAFSDRIYDRLVAALGDEQVFQDVDNIPAGADFRKVLHREIQRSDVVLVVIGPHWADAVDDSGQKRLGNPADFVRIEVESALNSRKYVIPVLIDGAKMPSASDLPVQLHELLFRNAASVRHNPDFKVDMERLIKVIEGLDIKSPVNDAIESASFSPAPKTPPQTVPAIQLPDLSSFHENILKFLPRPFEWCFVPAGNVTLRTGHSYEVPAFAIGKYAITNAQYQVFMESQGGHSDDKSWYSFSKEAHDYREEDLKRPFAAFAGHDLPRTNVSWFDAVAFCRWLGAMTDDPITLTSEQQWQRAASGDTGNIFPWGNVFDASRCCFSASQPVSVTAYPDGVSPYGALNMSGNVYEWCLNDYDKPADVDPQSSVIQRVLRGGSWSNKDPRFLRVDYRRDAYPRSTNNSNVGFRLVLSLPTA